MNQLEVALTILLGASILWNVFQYFQNRDLADELYRKLMKGK